jgi:hypothetical protein
VPDRARNDSGIARAVARVVPLRILNGRLRGSLGPAKAKLVAARGDDTIRTRVFDIVRNLDWPALYTGRALQNAFSRQWHGREAELEKSPFAKAAIAPRSSCWGNRALLIDASYVPMRQISSRLSQCFHGRMGLQREKLGHAAFCAHVEKISFKK